MYKDDNCRSNPQPPPPNSVEFSVAATTATATAAAPAVVTTHEQHPTAIVASFNTSANSADRLIGDHKDASSFPSDSSSDTEYEPHSRPSTTSTSSSSAAAVIVGTTAATRRCSQPKNHRQQHCDINSDIRLLRKIGYIASRVRLLAKIYGDFKLVNPYSPAKQRRQLQEILLKHSIHDPVPPAAHRQERHIISSSRSNTPVSSVASSYHCLPTESSCEDDTNTTAGTVRRKSSTTTTTTATVSPSILLLEDLLIQFYEDRRNKVTVIRRRRSRRSRGATSAALGASGNRNHLIIMSGKTASSSVERLLQLSNENDDECDAGDGRSGGAGVGDIISKTSAIFNPTITGSNRNNALLQATLGGGGGDDNTRRRRASDCSTHPGQALSNQLQITLKNNNFTKLPFHRGSCGAAGDHLMAANSIANRSTIILSKSCSNVDGGSGNVTSNPALYASSDLRNLATAATSAITAGGSGGIGFSATTGNGAGASSANGNNEYSIVQLNNTIIQCHFNDDDFRAFVKDLKRRVEYTERMNWLCLSKRPMGPPHRKSSLPKHQEVKKRFLEICDTTFSDEVKAALRLPAFDSYEWSDADVIHLMQTMFIELGFIERFNIPPETLREWLYEVYKHYNEVPFHNFRHCFCVAQMMYAITRQANLLQRLGDLECLILLVSCICHDLDHPGYNNIYQINARTELALRYNDISPLENHHCSIAFRLLEHPDCNIFKNFNRETFNQIREGIIRCILATDMARHNEIVTQFKDITPIFDYSNRAHINLLCMVLIKVADISNEARPMDVAEPWLDRLLQEFFAQSAAEKSEGLPVTPFMDPDKVSKPGSQVRFIGLVLLPLFEALGELVPEVIDLIVIPVRVALDYYKRLNDAQNKSRKSVVDTSSTAASENNSCASDNTITANNGSSNAAIAASSAGGGGLSGTCGGSVSPQMPRSQSGISVKSRRSIPSQKSASRTSVDEPQCIAAELHDLPEGSESGDSETATEVDVAEKTSKFKVDTEGNANRSKSSHSASRKSSREKRPSMIGEMCSSGGGQRTRNSYGNIHGYHSNRCHFSSNRAVSLDQYSTNNRRLSDGLQQVISDSNVFYNRQNRGSLEAAAGIYRVVEDQNMNATEKNVLRQPTASMYHQHMPKIDSSTEYGMMSSSSSNTATGTAAAALIQSNQNTNAASSNGNISPTQIVQPKQHCCAAAAAAAAIAAAAAVATNNNSNGVPANGSGVPTSSKPSWKARLKQFSDYLSFSFDKNSKRFNSTRSSPCSVRNNNATIHGPTLGILDPATGKTGVCCTISNNLQSPGRQPCHLPPRQEQLINAGRNRAYSLDVPCSHTNPRYSSSSGGGGDSSRKSSRNEGGGTGDENNSNNTLHSSGGAGSEMPTCLPPPIRIGSVDASDTLLIGTALPRVITPTNLSETEPSLNIDLGMVGSSTYEPPKI